MGAPPRGLLAVLCVAGSCQAERPAFSLLRNLSKRVCVYIYICVLWCLNRPAWPPRPPPGPGVPPPAPCVGAGGERLKSGKFTRAPRGDLPPTPHYRHHYVSFRPSPVSCRIALFPTPPCPPHICQGREQAARQQRLYGCNAEIAADRVAVRRARIRRGRMQRQKGRVQVFGKGEEGQVCEEEEAAEEEVLPDMQTACVCGEFRVYY